MSLKYCSDCRHYDGPIFGICRHPDSRELDGRQQIAIALRKGGIRSPCGIDAQRFEPKPPPTPEKPGLLTRLFGRAAHNGSAGQS